MARDISPSAMRPSCGAGVEGSDGVWVSGGFSGHGNGFAYAAAELMASLVRSGTHPDADLFDPQRP